MMECIVIPTDRQCPDFDSRRVGTGSGVSRCYTHGYG